MIQKIENLLFSTGILLKQQEKIRQIKGETFNIFSILKLERLEVRTHTAFIGELLRPDGSHQRGSLFLNLFLDELKVDHIDIHSSSVRTEIGIGQIDNEKKTGGRIDILIIDKQNSCVCIENKIDANDQLNQLERYCNYNKSVNKVFYLNLFGDEPNDISKGNLKSGEDFKIITYRTEILNWLEKCLKETSDFPILRESIKQYLILVKKITNSMDDKERQDVNELMLRFFNESNFITENFTTLKAQIGEDIRKAVKNSLEINLGKEFNIYLGNNSNNFYSQIWIKYKMHDSAAQYFGIESFGYKYNQALDVGVFNTGGKPITYTYNDVKGETNYWPYYATISDFEGFSINFNDERTLRNLYVDKNFKSRFIAHIVNEVENFIMIHKSSLLAFLENSTMK